MKRILALLLSLMLLLPALSLAEEDEDDILIEDLDESLLMTEDELEELLKDIDTGDTVSADTLEKNPNLPDNVINILLIGVDARGTLSEPLLSQQLRKSNDVDKKKSIPKRSDVLIILSINTDDLSIKLTSIARNLYLELLKWSQKNEEVIMTKGIIANSFGSAVNNSKGEYVSWIDRPDLCVRTVNHNFGLNIQYYIATNFYGVIEIIEQLGGVDIDLTRQEALDINKYLRVHKRAISNHYDTRAANRKKLTEKAGVQHLDGLQGLMYARLRESDNDHVRTARVRHLLDTLLKSAVSQLKDGSLDFTNFAVNCTRYMITNMDLASMVQLALNVYTNGLLSKVEGGADTLISQMRIPMDGTFYYDQNRKDRTLFKEGKKQENIEELHRFIYGQYYPAD